MSDQVLEFVHELRWQDVPAQAQHAVRRSLLDLLGVAASAVHTPLALKVRRHALDNFCSATRPAQLMFDGRQLSAPGAALAGAFSLDAIDAHDGYKPAKGHVGCGVLPALLAFADLQPMSGQQFLSALVVGYEFGSRAGVALHASADDYHTSGAWIAVACAAIGGRCLGLNREQTREAMGIAEYHGPRSQMMRCIDHPTMVKDGSGWGAMAGVSAALLAEDGFTGAPAVTVESPELQCYWSDIGARWLVEEQYIKAFPVCRWAQPAITAALQLRAQYGFTVDEIATLEIRSFHESVCLHSAQPLNTEQAQYSLPFPVAAALVHGAVAVEHISGDGLLDPAVLALSRRTRLIEEPAYNDPFPQRRISSVLVELRDGRVLASGPTETGGDPEDPFDDSFLTQKFFALATAKLGASRARELHDAVWALGRSADADLSHLQALIYAPVEAA